MTTLLETTAPPAAGSAPGSAGNPVGGAEIALPPGDPEAEALVAFLAELAEAHVAARSARVYVGHLGRFAGWLRARYGPDRGGLLTATGLDVRAYRHQLAVQQRPASVNNGLAALRRFYRWAQAAGLLLADPTARVKPAPAQPLSPKGFSPVERNRLVREAERAGAVASAVVATLLHTGLRVEELCGLTWAALRLSPRAGSARVVGKGRKERTAPLNATVREALAAIRPQGASGRPQEDTGAIFRGKRGPYSPRGVRDLLAVLGRRAGVEDVHPHRFRHDCVRRLVAAAVDLPTVAARLGHSRLDTVRLYSQPGEDELQRAAAVLET